MEPTAIALLDLELRLGPVLVNGNEKGSTYRDALVLVRLHGQPLEVLYVNSGLSQLSTPALYDLVWSRLESVICLHASKAGCMALPESAEAIPTRADGETSCSLENVPQPSGSVAVIVPTTARRTAQLRRCLAALADLPGPEYEVIVVNNTPGPPDVESTVNEARGLTERTICYLEEPRPGSSVARNRAASQTQADILAFTDDDVVVDRNWLRWLVEPFVSSDVGAATGMVLPLELETPAQKNFELYGGGSKGLQRLSYDLESNRADHRLLYPFWGGLFGSGNSMAFRREGYVARGGLDPSLGAGSLALAGADIEALSAVVLRGERLVYEPRSLCWHEHRRDDAALRRQLFNYGVGFTAILTKALLHDRRFPIALARSIPVALELRRRQQSQSLDRPTLSPALARLERLGMLEGPVRYARSAVWSRRLGLNRVIRGQ